MAFDAVAEKIYRVESKVSLADPTWTEIDIFTNNITGSITNVDQDAVSGTTNRFYRIKCGPNGEVVTDPAGYYGVTLSAGPNAISVPLYNFATARGLVDTVSGNTVTVKVNPGWTANAFAPKDGYSQYILLVRKDALASPGIEGDWWTIASNTGNTLTLSLGTDVLSSLLGSGDQIEVRRLTSMKDLFGTGTTLILNKDSNGNAASGDSSQADVIRFISGTSFRAPIFYHDGTLLPAGYYVEGGNVGPLDGSTITVLPGQGFMVFRKSGSGATTVLVNGQVQVSRLTQYLKVGPEVIGSPFASAAPIGTSGLLESGWVSDRDGSAAAGDWSKASLFRLISGTSFEASVFQHDGSILSPAGWYDANGVLNNNYPLQPGSAYIFSITPTNAVRWRQAVPYEPVARQGFGWIPPGQFLMGSPAGEQDRESDEGPQTLVTLSRGFWIGQHEVTQGEYLAVMGSNPSRFTGDLSRPVEQVSWSEATNYCGKLTEQERAAGRLPGGWVYRLPTKAEWEYAARAGTTTRFSFGDDPGYTILGEYSWFAGNSGSSTHAVQSKRPNLRGLYDMQGNVWEWCWDRYVAWLPGGSLTDPAGPATRLRTRRSPAG